MAVYSADRNPFTTRCARPSHHGWASAAGRLVSTCLLLIGSAQAADPLEIVGLRASGGAAAGYLADAACAQCHPSIARSYAEVGMARSFAPAASGKAMPFDGSRHAHAPSGLDYRLERRADELWFVQAAKAADASTLKLELRVDWVLGSGNRAQSFLHHTEAGELYQLPVTWYSESGRLAMSPGYEAADHPGVERRVRRQCMFCHNAYPEVAVDSDRADQPDLFPRQLPAGVGCQRCHGPGAEHVRAVLTGKGLERIHAAIVNPARLAWPERNDVCFQCHLLPAVEVVGARRVDRADYSFRPGEPLHDYLLHVDIAEAGRSRDDRFQINHHAYRLQQSACYIESKAQMGCVSCHDPHVRRVGAAAVGWYRERCLACHQDLAPIHGQADAAAAAATDQRDCAGCHMPKRRTQDVIEVTMTDHRIARGPFDLAALRGPLQPRDPQIRDLQLFARPPAMGDAESAAYRALIALDNNIGGVAGSRALEKNLDAMTNAHRNWWLQLARHQVGLGQYAEADASIARMDRPTRVSASVRHLSALIDVSGGRADEGLRTLRDLARRGEFQPELDYNLALLERRKGRLRAAVRALKRMLEARPLSAVGWLQLARTHAEDGDQPSADRAYQRALSIRPALQTETPPLTTHD